MMSRLYFIILTIYQRQIRPVMDSPNCFEIRSQKQVLEKFAIILRSRNNHHRLSFRQQTKGRCLIQSHEIDCIQVQPLRAEFYLLHCPKLEQTLRLGVP